MRRSIGAGIGFLRTGQRNYGSGRGRLWLAVLTVAFAGALVLIPFAAAAEIAGGRSVDAHPCDHFGPQLRCLPRWGRVPGVLRRHSVRHVARVRRCALRAGQHSCRRLGHPPLTPVHAGQPDGSDRRRGTKANPYKIVTVVDRGSTGLRLTETDTYVIGQESYRTDVAVEQHAAGRHGDAFCIVRATASCRTPTSASAPSTRAAAPSRVWRPQTRRRPDAHRAVLPDHARQQRYLEAEYSDGVVYDHWPKPRSQTRAGAPRTSTTAPA